MENIMKTFRFLSIILIAVFVISACGAPAAQAKPPLKIGWSLWPGWYPIVIAQEKGFFAKHNVEVEPVFYSAYAATLPEFSSGKLDGVGLVVGDVIPLIKKNNAKIVMVTDNSNGADVIMAGPEVNSPADLRGKRIGIGLGTFGEVLARQMLAANNLSLGDVALVQAAPEDVPSDLGTNIDAGHTFEPFSSEARQKGYHPIFSSADVPGLIADVLVFQTKTITERPEDIRAFLAAWFEALAWWQDHPAEGNTLIAKVTNQKAEDISIEGLKLFNQADNLAAFQLGKDTRSLYYTTQEYTKFYQNTGVLSALPDLKQLLDPSYLH
jgi:ABC-type nitrate/sulfonate/bicarbonate transport system substrate-binding protein